MSFENVPNFLLNFFEAQMTGNPTRSYRFNSFLLDVAERQLFHHGKPIALTPKAFDVLVYLIQHGGHLVLKDDLMQAVWADSFVNEVNLPRTVHTIRTTLGEDSNGNKFIETVPTKGYRFVAKVEEVNGNGPRSAMAEGVFAITDQRLGGLDPHSVANEKRIPHIEEEKDPRAKHPKTFLIVAFATVLAVLVTGSWFTYRPGSAKTNLSASQVQTDDGEAHQLYKQGKVLIERGRGDDIHDALTSFERAIELDPNFAAAYVGKADAKIRIFWASNSHDDISQARAAINKAIEIDESNSYAHTLLCRINGTYDWDFGKAERECLRAVQLDPDDHEAHRETAFLFSALGRENEALREIDQAVELAPTSFNKRSRGMILYYSRRYDEAIEQLSQVEAADPTQQDTRRWLTFAYEMNRDLSHAFEAQIRQMEFEEAAPEQIESVKTAFNEGGWHSVLRKILDTSKRPNQAHAAAYAQLGNNDKAFELLEKMFDRRAIMMVHIAREPRFDPIRNDPRFDQLLTRIGLK